MTVKELKDWLNALGPEFDNGRVESVVHGLPCVAKRVIAYTPQDGLPSIVVNSMGTHLDDEFFAETEGRRIVLQ